MSVDARFPHLDRMSRSFAEALFQKRPDWLQYAREDREGDADESYLVVEISGPDTSELDHPLLIMTNRGEVTVGMDYYHMHFEWPAREHEWMFDPLMFLDSLLSEDVAVVSSWADGKWAGSTVLKEDQLPVAEPGFVIRVRSWRGTHDKDLQGPGTL